MKWYEASHFLPVDKIGGLETAWGSQSSNSGTHFQMHLQRRAWAGKLFLMVSNMRFNKTHAK